MLSFSFTLAGRYAGVTLRLHKQACYYNMMECRVSLPVPLFMGHRNMPEIKACNSPVDVYCAPLLSRDI